MMVHVNECGLQSDSVAVAEQQNDWIDVSTLSDTERVFICMRTGARRTQPWGEPVFLFSKDKQ